MAEGLAIGEVLAGRYRVERRVGRGGFGEVYFGRHLVLDVPIAIKLLLAERFDDEEQRGTEVAAFLAEARLLARLKHPNIVSILDAGALVTTGLPWMVLSWCDGETLTELIASRAVAVPIPPDAAWRLLRPAAMAVAYANAERIAHRDLKPSNLVRDKASGELVVLDFGIAKVTRTGSTMLGPATRMAFSRAYAAPEQVFSGPTGPWTDVYAFALIFTELVTGVALGDAKADMTTSSGPTPSARGVDVGGQVEAVLARALSLPAKDRQQDLGELARDLDRALLPASVPPGAATASAAPAPSLTSWKNNRVILGGGAIAVLVVAVGTTALVVRGRDRASTRDERPAAARDDHHREQRPSSSPSPTAARSLARPASLDRVVPNFTFASFKSGATSAGFEVLDAKDLSSIAAKTFSLRVRRESCAGALQLFDYGSGPTAHATANQAAKAIRNSEFSTNFFIQDGSRIVLYALDSVKPGDTCAIDLADALTPLRRH